MKQRNVCVTQDLGFYRAQQQLVIASLLVCIFRNLPPSISMCAAMLPQVTGRLYVNIEFGGSGGLEGFKMCGTNSSKSCAITRSHCQCPKNHEICRTHQGTPIVVHFPQTPKKFHSGLHFGRRGFCHDLHFGGNLFCNLGVIKKTSATVETPCARAHFLKVFGLDKLDMGSQEVLMPNVKPDQQLRSVLLP